MLMSGASCEAIAEAKDKWGWEDDHVATIHDFYLEQQAFGAGRHLKTGTSVFQDIETSYTVTMSVLEHFVTERLSYPDSL
jgi:hypothetical protein